jgi:hypothetical protein
MRQYRASQEGRAAMQRYEKKRTLAGHYKLKEQRRTESQYHLWRKYRMRPEEFQRRLKEQNHCCAACLRPFLESDIPCVDHDHACCPGKRTCGRCVRGLLHRTCNQVLGFFDDDIEKLNHFERYLSESNYETTETASAKVYTEGSAA